MTPRSSDPGERGMRYRLDVFAPNVLDAVKAAGGWNSGLIVAISGYVA